MATLEMKSSTAVDATTRPSSLKNELELHSKLERVGRRFDPKSKIRIEAQIVLSQPSIGTQNLWQLASVQFELVDLLSTEKRWQIRLRAIPEPRSCRLKIAGPALLEVSVKRADCLRYSMKLNFRPARGRVTKTLQFIDNFLEIPPR